MGIKIKSTIDFSKIVEQTNKDVQLINKKEKMELTPNHIKVLEMLEQRVFTGNPPVGMTKEQMNTCLKDMKDVYVRATFVMGGDVLTAELLQAGQAALDDRRQALREKLKRLIPQGYDDSEIAVWLWLSDREVHYDMPEGIDIDDFDAIMKDMIRQGFVKEPLTKEDGYKLSLKGKRLLEMWLQEDLPTKFTKTNASSPMYNHSSIKIKEGKKSSIIKIIYALAGSGLLEKTDGSKVDIYELMEAMGTLLNEPSLKDYSSSLSESAKNQETTFLAVFDDLEAVMKKYYKEAKERREERRNSK